MSEGILRRLFAGRPRRAFLAWQVELTTRCPLRCRMCIREGGKDWRNADMPIDDFRRLAPYFSDVANVVLEGWGEPLLYKDLIEAIRTVNRAGSHAGFVTSGWGLNEDYCADLVAAGVDFVGFSLAGATPATHEAIRVNSGLADILQAIEHFARIKADRKRDAPRLHIVFLMLKDNLPELGPLLDLAKRVGIGRIVLINLVQVTNEWQNAQKVFSCRAREAPAILGEAAIRARELDIELAIPCVTPHSIGICGEDPTRNLYISVDGEVAPCVYLHPPVASPIRTIFCDTPVEVAKLTFGNIFEQPLERIWNGPRYAAFRERFRAREQTLAAACSLSARMVPDHGLDPGEEPVLPEAPGPCRTCHRLLGI